VTIPRVTGYSLSAAAISTTVERRLVRKRGGGRASLPSRCSEQRLALDAVLCGGLIRGKGARLRIRHRLAPLPLAAPRDAACAAPPASPSPECGIEGIPRRCGPLPRLAVQPILRPPDGILPVSAAASMPPCRARAAAPGRYLRGVYSRVPYSLLAARLRLRRQTPRPCGPLRV
jgi:hypothetical protein